uniref:Neur_chan_LBD domain-containing protein n=1 Tax=Macrostomum lignano TaxID=282301 RepID=A0A1I8F9R2_9PLAT
ALVTAGLSLCLYGVNARDATPATATGEQGGWRGLNEFSFSSACPESTPRIPASNSMSDAKRLFNRLLNPTVYKSYVRPVTNHSQPILLYMKPQPRADSRCDEKNQIVTLNMWVFQQWHDPNFIWDPASYDNIRSGLQIWCSTTMPEVTGPAQFGQQSQRVLGRHGAVEAAHNIQEPNCTLKLGTWTHNGFLIDLRHVAQMEEALLNRRVNFDNCQAFIDYAVDLSQFVENGEWDILRPPPVATSPSNRCCPEPYLDLTFSLRIRRKTLFYRSGEKMSLSVNILVSLTVFFWLIFDICPPTSRVVPLILKYLLFTMALVTLSVMATVVVINVHWRSPDGSVMAPWVRRVFFRALPRLLLIRMPPALAAEAETEAAEAEL